MRFNEIVPEVTIHKVLQELRGLRFFNILIEMIKKLLLVLPEYLNINSHLFMVLKDLSCTKRGMFSSRQYFM